MVFSNSLHKLVLAGAASVVYSVSPTDYTKIYNSAITTNFEGWGTSLAWWASFVGAADRCQAKKTMDYFFSKTAYPSLALNIVRYNIGGAPNSTWDGINVGDPNFDSFKGISSFWLPNGQWNWDADMGQRRILAGAIQAGVNIIEAFANSPPYWMTNSGNSRGNIDGSDNLSPANFSKFAEYLATVVQKFRTTYGVNISSVEPFNEPNGFWWNSSLDTSNSEGCAFSGNNQTAFLPYLQASLTNRNLNGVVQIASADEYAYSWAIYNRYGGATYNYSQKVNTHGYGYSNKQSWNVARLAWYQNIPTRITRRWMSEVSGFGSTPQNLTEMASNIILDLNIARVTAWIYWQALDGNGYWTLLNPNSKCLLCQWLSLSTYNPVPNKLYYVLMQFSYHIRQGSTILNSTRANDLDECIVCVVAAYDPSKKSLIIVATNNDQITNYAHTFDLSQFISISPSTQTAAFRTNGLQNETHASVANPVVNVQRTFTYTLFASSITTFVLNGVTN